jgi:hypothetical protein
LPTAIQAPASFSLAIDALALPSRVSFSKAPFTSFNPANRFHMIESIELVGFRDKVSIGVGRDSARTR